MSSYQITYTSSALAYKTEIETALDRIAASSAESSLVMEFLKSPSCSLTLDLDLTDGPHTYGASVYDKVTNTVSIRLDDLVNGYYVENASSLTQADIDSGPGGSNKFIRYTLEEALYHEILHYVDDALSPQDGVVTTEHGNSNNSITDTAIDTVNKTFRDPNNLTSRD